MVIALHLVRGESRVKGPQIFFSSMGRGRVFYQRPMSKQSIHCDERTQVCVQLLRCGGSSTLNVVAAVDELASLEHVYHLLEGRYVL